MKRAADISTSQLHSDTETVPNDLSILRKPIKTSVNGLNEARKAYDDGTDEIRKLLSNECDIIYECKVCRNLFRSLANFISHKRIYCKTTYCSSLQYDYHNDGRRGFSQDISTIVQAEEEFIGAVKSSKNNEKDLSSIVERLIKREKAGRLMKLSDFYEQVNNKLTQDEMLQKRHVLHLDVVPESSVAVYQTVQSPDDPLGDNIKSQVIEIQNITDQSRTVLGPDGKVVSPSDLPKFPDDDDKLPQPFECEVCNCKFATEKTLKLHIETKHIPSTYVYQCPSCGKTFLQVGQVIRHLTNDHKKSMRRVRLMRDSILKRRTRIDEVQVKGPSRELARLQSDKERVDSQNKAWLDNLEDNDNSCKNICLFCGRQFDRRAVLLSHHKVCQQKKKPNTRISLTRKVDHDRPGSNGWNDREFDDSSNSNSNSLDGALMDDSSIPTFKEKVKLIKNEPDVVKNEVDSESMMGATVTATATTTTTTTTTSRRKKSRTAKAVVTEEAPQSDDEKSLNICWNLDEPLKIKEESVSPVDDTNLSSSGNNNTGDDDIQMKAIKTEEPIVVKEEKRTRTTNGASIRTTDTKPKSKLTSSHCKYCFKKFSNASNLRRHITMSHFDAKKFTCNLCTFRARRKNDILGHMRTKHQMSGERTDALKFVTVNEEPTPKPPISFNRRKDKHTEVLRDDEEEIFIDNEAFVLEETTEQLLSLGTPQENSNVDMDDDSINPPTETPEEANKPNSSLKRKGRPKTKDKFKKLNERSLSPNEQKEGESLPARRPVRNRIMPVKKDFVYDLFKFQDDFQKQSLVQPVQTQTQTQTQAQTQPQPQTQPSNQPPQVQVKSRNTSPIPIDNKIQKRRNLLPDAGDSSENEQQLNTDQTKADIRKLPTQPQSSPKDEIVVNQSASDVTSIKGAAEAMAQQAVQANRAVFFKPPELPTERPVATPQRQFDSTAMKDWPILKRPPAMYDGLKSKLSNLKVPGLKRKRRSCLLKHSSTSKPLNHKNRLYDKHKADTNGHTDNRYKCNDLDQQIPEMMKISSKLADKIQLQCAQVDSDSGKAIKSDLQPISSTNASTVLSKAPETATAAAPVAPTTPRRMTLLERLAENKTKKLNESLSRMSIANSDNESDED